MPRQPIRIMEPEDTFETAESHASDDIVAALRRGDEVALRLLLAELHPGEVADIIESLTLDQRDLVWDLLMPDVQADVLVDVSDALRDHLIERMAPAELLATTAALDPDDAADLVGDLPGRVAGNLLRAMSEEDRQQLESILAYPEDTAGGLMTPEVLTVRADTDLEVVLRYLRQRGSLPEATDNLAVVDRENNYLGQLPVATLLTNRLETLVGEIMDHHAVAIPVSLPASDVARLFEQRDLISAPVVDASGKLIGRITIDDVVDVLREEADTSFFGLAGANPDEDLFAPIRRSLRGRNLWLGVNLMTALLASSVIGLFDATLEKMVALAILMPIVASMGGNAGSQTLALVIRGMALDQISRHNAAALLRKELLVGTLNGLLWAGFIAATAGLWFRDPGLGLIIGVAMVINLVFAAGAGFTIPVLLRRFGIDPAVASSVFLTTVTDVVGFATFLGLAALFLV